MAAGIMRRLYAEQKVNAQIESAGTADWNTGRSADHRAISVSREFGIDISSHRARQISAEDFENFDHILIMDKSNQSVLQKIAPKQFKNKIRFIVDSVEISDPYSGDLATFRQTFKLLEKSCSAFLSEIENNKH
jgi:protein-tyrosine phosphatase